MTRFKSCSKQVLFFNFLFPKLFSSFYFSSDWLSPGHWCCVPQQGDHKRFDWFEFFSLFCLVFSQKNFMIISGCWRALHYKPGPCGHRSKLSPSINMWKTNLEANMEHQEEIYPKCFNFFFWSHKKHHELEETNSGDLNSGFLPCTPNGCIKLIERTGVKVSFLSHFSLYQIMSDNIANCLETEFVSEYGCWQPASEYRSQISLMCLWHLTLDNWHNWWHKQWIRKREIQNQWS